ncbi:MAG: EAL domain-containing protein, partial [Solirubrobacteraceae bacterium]
DAKAARMLGAILGVARAAECKAIAEGIETESQLEVVRDLGCDGGQGFLFASPAPAEQTATWLRARACG